MTRGAILVVDGGLILKDESQFFFGIAFKVKQICPK